MTQLPKRISLVAQTTEILRREMESGAWVEFLPGEIPLSKRLQVGRPTVRAALDQLQREGWIEVAQGRQRRILHRPTRKPSADVPKTVGILAGAQLHSLSPFLLYLIGELQGPLHEAGCRLEVNTLTGLGTRHPPRWLEKLVERARAMGWVLLGPGPHVQRWFREQRIPCLGVGASPDDILIPYLRVDYRAAARHAVGTLASRGYRRVGLVLARPQADGKPIREGFERELRATARLTGLVLWHDGTVESVRTALTSALLGDGRPDSLLVVNPKHVLTVMTHLLHAGLRIPADVAVFSLGHDPSLDQVVPTVARYEIDWPNFARKLCRCVLELAETGKARSREMLVMPRFRDGETLGRRAARSKLSSLQTIAACLRRMPAVPRMRACMSTRPAILLALLLATFVHAQEAGIAVIDTPEKAKAAQAAWAAKLGKPVQWSNAAGMKFQLIPPGEFDMGAKDGDKDAPLHRVRITEPFYLGTFEVTRAEWEKVTGKKHSNFFPGPTHPMNHIHHYTAASFCGQLSKADGFTNTVYRLPTEAEWEYAARAGTTTRYHTGDSEADLDKAGWYEKNSGGTTHPVGQKAANAFGLHDMHGNVWEWTADFCDPDFYGKSPPENPSNPKPEFPNEYVAMRGGSCFFDASFCTSWHRDRYEPSRTLNHAGIRMLIPAKSLEAK